MKYDFAGWVTRNDILCTDGRTIRKDAFKHNNGEIVPLVWNHQHNSPENILGQVLLENRPEGVYGYGSFNDTESGKKAKELVTHGDIRSLSICANRLKQSEGNVLHGEIKEVSLVIAGANSGAFIDSVMHHGEESEDALIVCYDENIVIYHSDDEPEDNPDDKKTKTKEKTIQDVIDTMNDEQQEVLYGLVGAAIEDTENKYKENGGKEDMKHNAFENETPKANVLTHDDQMEILKTAKSSTVGSFKAALELYAEKNELDADKIMHADALSSGFAQDTGDGNVSWLFPEYKDVRPGAPELVTYDQGWVSAVLRKVHKSPISRIRTSQVDIRNIDALRAKGYKKGKEKSLAGNFKLARRTTDPQTVYVKSALHRDDIVDITDFDYVNYLYNIDKLQLNEELAMAIMLGDGREEGDEGKIDETHIRPIWLDDDLYTLHVDLDLEGAKQELQGTGTGTSFGENFITAEAMINTVLYARENFKGTGTPDLYCTPHMVNVMLLARDMNGRRIYSTVQELASALNVGEIHTAEQFEGKERTTEDAKKKKLVAIICNVADYSLGATKGGEITHFTQFDIDFNQQKSLLETRCSGALTRIYSAIAIEEDITDGDF